MSTFISYISTSAQNCIFLHKTFFFLLYHMGHKSLMFQILHSTKNMFIYIYNLLYLIHISIIFLD